MTRLVCCSVGGREFRVRKEILLRLDLFDNNGSLLDKKYVVNSRVSANTFALFIDAVGGKIIQVTKRNCNDLSLLCEEFGYRGLDECISAVMSEATARDNDLVWRIESLENSVNSMKVELRKLCDLMPRVNHIEKCILCVSNDVTTRMNRVGRQVELESDERRRDVEDLKRSFEVWISDLNSTVQTTSGACGKLGDDITAVEGKFNKLVMSAFAGTSLRKVVIPSTVNEIRDGAFKRCYELRTVVFERASRVCSIGKEAFAWCRNIESIVIPASVYRVDVTSFAGCDIKTFSVEDGNISFVVHESLLLSFDRMNIVCCFGKRVSIPKTIANIGTRTFYQSLVETVIIPKHVKTVASDSFEGCRRLRQLTVQNQHHIGRYTGSNLGGIIAHLRSQCTGNLCENGIISITTSGGDADFRRVVDYEWSGHWSSQNHENSWIMFDFGGNSVSLTHYILRSANPYFPIQWQIGVSNDKQAWTTIDNRQTDSLGDKNSHVFRCEAQDSSSRFVRVVHTGKNGSGGNSLRLSGVEFFGTIQRG